MKRLSITLLFLLACGCLYAQTLVKGQVVESGNGIRLENVFVKDMTNKQITLTDKNGRFAINTETGHLLIFSLPGYVADTLYVVDLTQKHVELKNQPIQLREVTITANRESSFDPHKEYPEVYEKAKVYPLSPSTWFSRDAKNARRLKRYFQTEQEERIVDKVFTRAYVGSLVPLKGQELEDFMTLFRPSYKFITSNNSESLVAYINDSYKKYKALPPEKRSLAKLDSLSH
ncbi:MAG: carboxypeptidase-like regulatory domain-containing protein [Bacteroidetes bacterium]|nr:carboxypeptidase-like regulatory domain-containing protein [Bacteroidota bacterium]